MNNNNNNNSNSKYIVAKRRRVRHIQSVTLPNFIIKQYIIMPDCLYRFFSRDISINYKELHK